MQTWSGQNTGGASTQKRKLITTVVLSFSLVGLIAGFAIGGVTAPKSPTTAAITPVAKPTKVVQPTATATPSPTPAPDITLGFPKFTDPGPVSPESATGATTYTVTMQAVDKQNKPVHSTDVVCKLWLVKQIPAHRTLDIDTKTLKNVNNISNPITGSVNKQPAPEVSGALSMVDSTATPQTTHCDANGQATWKYTIAPTVPAGDYDLVILADWKGVHFNWSWVNITIR